MEKNASKKSISQQKQDEKEKPPIVENKPKKRKFTITCTTKPVFPSSSSTFLVKLRKYYNNREKSKKQKKKIKKEEKENIDPEQDEKLKSDPFKDQIDEEKKEKNLEKNNSSKSLKKEENSNSESKTESPLFNEIQTKNFVSNYVTTSKYTALTFITSTLFKQITKPLIIYFILLSLLQSLPLISPLNPFTSITPLLFIISISMIREAFEDLERHKVDLELNSSKCEIWKDGAWHVQDWISVHVGDLVKVRQFEGEHNEKRKWGDRSGFGVIPADLICLGSSSCEWVPCDWRDKDFNGVPDDEEGICYISTSNLDGQSDLKARIGFEVTQSMIGDGEIMRIVGDVEMGPPNPDFYNIEGKLHIPGHEPLEITYENFLPRGSILMNTEWVIGVCAYTGHDTKIMQNTQKPTSDKTSHVQKITIQIILIVFGIQAALSLTMALFNGFWVQASGRNHSSYIPYRFGSIFEGFLASGTLFVLTNSMVPISLLISLEMVQLVQAYFINVDEDMSNRKIYSRVLDSKLNDELGQIECVFCDKTGTLTKNQMDLKVCIIGDCVYGDVDSILGMIKKRSKRGKNYERDAKNFTLFSEEFDEDYVFGQTSAFWDKRLLGLDLGLKDDKLVNLRLKDTRNGREIKEYKYQYDLVYEFFLLLAICHDCKPVKNCMGVKYEGQSHDEVSLVVAASKVGFTYLSASHGFKTLDILGQKVIVQQLNYFPFTSRRKRSSTIIKHEGKIKLFVKGSNDFIMERLVESSKISQPYAEGIESSIRVFAKKGLRVMCMAVRVISEAEYSQIARELKNAKRLSNYVEVEEEIMLRAEKGLTLIGCTAVEDKIAHGVIETIEDFSKAEIDVWMLTGDKLETAQSVAYACKLFKEDYKTIIMNGYGDFQSAFHVCKNQIDQYTSKNHKVALIVNGSVISQAVSNSSEASVPKFANEILSRCSSVLCYRASPEEKAQLVNMVKTHLKKVTLAIGDGANDVNMLQEANVGIALYNNQSVRIVQAADYVVPNFGCLWKLLFVHGRWNYMRISEMILYYFYKNMLFTIPQIIFCFFNAYSGQSIFEDWFISFYNLFFTSVPVVARAIFDKDVYYLKWNKHGNEQYYLRNMSNLRENYPYLYFVSKEKKHFSIAALFGNIALGILVGIFITFVVLNTFGQSPFDSSGQMSDIWAVSIVLYTAIIFAVDLKLALKTKTWTIFNFIALIGLSVVVYVIFILITDAIPLFSSYKTAMEVFTSFHVYFITLLLCGITYVLDMTIMIIQKESQTTLSILFKSIIRSGRENETKVFDKIVEDFQKRRRIKTVLNKNRKKNGGEVINQDFEKRGERIEKELDKENDEEKPSQKQLEEIENKILEQTIKEQERVKGRYDVKKSTFG